MNKLNLCIIFGGKSAEHEVSLQSAYNIVAAADREKYNLTLIAMNKEGKFYLCDSLDFLENSDNPKNIKIKNTDNEIAFIPGERGNSIYSLRDNKVVDPIDVIFPIIHGPFGEDGSLQGLLKLIGVPFVGAGVVGSAVGMDKDIMKRLLRDNDIEIADFIIYRDIVEADYSIAKEKLGIPMFIKPANLGSSVGISKVSNKDEFFNGLKKAFKFDGKVIVEEFIDGREIECAVKGNLKAEATFPGEILPTDDFYSYEAKYINETGAILKIPAELDNKIADDIKEIAKETYKLLETRGLARIDFFVTKDRVLVNEINTLPGFTKISMYPKLWKNEGVKYPDLIDELIALAIEEFKNNDKLLSTI
ncbi:D-alanine--D-alanine ligase [Clostridiaceae bacterium HSG29]|nr:D-alanine--D-alanine ligase [Clostridiaceae bacterium HSG29]